MGYRQRSPLPIINGGTNTETLTNTNGTIVYNGTSLATVAPGTAGFVLTSNGAGSVPSYQSNPADGIATINSDAGSSNGPTVTISGGTSGLTTSITGTTLTIAGTLAVVNGGTGTATQFTQGSVVFAGASGVYAQDNANFFWDATDHQLGVGTNAMTAYNLVQFSNLAAFSHMLTLTGNVSAVDASNHQHGLQADGNYAPTAGSALSTAVEAVPVFSTPVGQTITAASGIHISNTYGVGNLGTITTGYGLWCDGGSALGAGTLTSQYSGYFATPVAGTNKQALYADDLSIGVAASGSASAGTIKASSTISSGVAGSSIGGLLVSGNTSGTVSILPQAAAGTYNFNLPTTAGSAGEVLTSAGGAGSPMTWTAVGGGGVTWIDQTTTPVTLAVDSAYSMNAGASLITATLPTTAAFGTVIQVSGYGSGGWTIAQNANQMIHFGAVTTTTGVGGSLSSTDDKDQVTMVCAVANLEWVVNSSIGNITYV